MTRKKTRITLEGWRPLSTHDGKSGLAVALEESASPLEWLLHLRKALDALFEHEARKVIETLRVKDRTIKNPYYPPKICAADIAYDEVYPGEK